MFFQRTDDVPKAPHAPRSKAPALWGPHCTLPETARGCGPAAQKIEGPLPCVRVAKRFGYRAPISQSNAPDRPRSACVERWRRRAAQKTQHAAANVRAEELSETCCRRGPKHAAHLRGRRRASLVACIRPASVASVAFRLLRQRQRCYHVGLHAQRSPSATRTSSLSVSVSPPPSSSSKANTPGSACKSTTQERVQDRVGGSASVGARAAAHLLVVDHASSSGELDGHARRLAAANSGQISLRGT